MTTSGFSRVALVAALLLGAAPAVAQPALDSLVPPSPAPGYIADGGPVLDDSARARLNARIAEVQRATGGDIAVAIVRDLRDRAPSDVGVAIYRAWGVGRVDSIGSARRDLGALLLIVPRELAPSGRGECWITTGLGAEGELRDADAGTICRRAIIPHLRERDYEAAVAAGIEGIAEAFAQQTAGAEPPGAVGDAARHPDRARARTVLGWIGGGIATILAAIAGIFGWRRHQRSRPRPCPRGHGMMTRLSERADDAALSDGQRTEERLKSVDYDVWACGECDARLVIPYKRWSSYEGCPKCRFRTVEQKERTLKQATTTSGGLEEITLTCKHCGWKDVTRRKTPKLTPASSGGGGGGGSGFGGGGGGGGGFGGSGRTAGGGGGSSY